MSKSEEIQPRTSLINRMIGAARLDEAIFREVEADGSAIIQALVVVALAAMASRLSIGGAGFFQLIVAFVRLTAWWLALTLIVYLLSITLMRPPEGRPNWLRLARTMGYAQSPVVLRGFLLLPFIGGTLWSLLFLSTTVWQFAAITVAVRLALKYESPTKAAITVGISFVPLAIVEPFLLR